MKVGWFQGDAQKTEDDSWLSQDEIMALPKSSDRRPCLRILLVPDNFDITLLGGDDWNDSPADCNAGPPNNEPTGSVWLDLYLGDRWPIIKGE